MFYCNECGVAFLHPGEENGLPCCPHCKAETLHADVPSEELEEDKNFICVMTGVLQLTELGNAILECAVWDEECTEGEKWAKQEILAPKLAAGRRAIDKMEMIICDNNIQKTIIKHN